MQREFRIGAPRTFRIEARGRLHGMVYAAEHDEGLVDVSSIDDRYRIEVREDEECFKLIIVDREDEKRQKSLKNGIADFFASPGSLTSILKSFERTGTHELATQDDAVVNIKVRLPFTVVSFILEAENANLILHNPQLDDLVLKASNLECSVEPETRCTRANIASNNLHLSFFATAELTEGMIKANNAKINIVRSAGFDGIFAVKSNAQKIDGELDGSNPNKVVRIKANSLKLKVHASHGHPKMLPVT